MLIVITAGILLVVLYVLLTSTGKKHPGLNAFKRWSFAHRGLHGNGVPENSMEAFRRARDAGYGIELDVHLLADGNLAVIHDSLLQRTTGAEGRVEDLTLEELNDYFLEGTMQTIPAFTDVLHLVNARIPLIVELKAVGENYADLCQTVCSVLNDYKGDYCLESFDPRCIYWLKKNRPDIIRGQLTEDFLKEKKVPFPWIVRFAVTFQVLNFLTQPHFVAYKFQDRKHISNWFVERIWKTPSVTWTILNDTEHSTAVKEGRIPIFEGFRPQE